MKLQSARGRLLPIIALLPISTRAISFWIDTSCANKIPNVVDEALLMARRGHARLANDADSNQADVFQRLFQQPKTDTATFDEVQRVMGGIGALTMSQSRAAADIRIYCDDDSYGNNGRWRPVADIPNLPPGVTPNSAKTRGVDQEYEDPVNGIRMLAGAMGCKDVDATGDVNTLAEVFTTRSAGPWPNENPLRATMTICDLTLNEPVKSFSDIPLKKDIASRNNMNNFNSMASMTVLHEFTHAPAWDKVDVVPNGYDYENIIKLSAADAIKNSDTYAVFGLFAKLADRNWRLSKKTNEAKDGKLVYDLTLPAKIRRGVENILASRNPANDRAPRVHAREWFPWHSLSGLGWSK